MAQRYRPVEVKVGRSFSRYAQAVASATERIAAGWAAAVGIEAVRRSPQNTGRLRSSFYARLVRTRDRVTATVGAACPYASFTEFGTRKFPVGTPQRPRTSWPTKRWKGRLYPNPSATVPYLRAAKFIMDERFRNALRQAGKVRATTA